MESQWFKGTRDQIERGLAKQVSAAAARTITDKCVYFGIGASVDEAVAYALNAASSRFKVSITEAQTDSTGKGVAVEEHVALGVFQFATGHSDLDFYMRPLKARVKAWTQTLPAEVRKNPGAFTYRVDGYASALGDKKVNTKLAADRRARVWAALQGALALDEKMTAGGAAHPNALEDPPDPTLLTAIESGDADGIDRRGDAETKNPAKHRVAIVQVLRKIVPPSKKDDVQVVEYRQDAKTAIPVFRLDLVAYQRAQVGGDPVTMVMIFFYPGEKIGG